MNDNQAKNVACGLLLAPAVAYLALPVTPWVVPIGAFAAVVWARWWSNNGTTPSNTSEMGR